MKKVHFVGVGGSGISGVAHLATMMGFDVSGCDAEEKSSYIKNFLIGHNIEHIKSSDIVVASPALLYKKPQIEEIKVAKDLGKLITWQQFVGDFLQKDKTVICVAGTHGKSTTTAMVGKLLVDAGFDPTVILGANVPSWKGNYKFGEGKYLIIEADEFNNNFLHYSPEIIILNNIEFDHPDFFKDEKAVFDSFKEFVNKLTGKKILIANSDDSGVNKFLDSVPKDVKVIKYSLTDSDVNLRLKVPGEHNVINAQGVVTLARELDIADTITKASIESFTGIERRSQLVAYENSIAIYDDYAHHPTAIAATLKGIRSLYPKNRIWAIIEPHGYSRTKSTLPLYKNAFKDADKVFVGPIFKARDNDTFNMSPKNIADISNHKDINYSDDFKTIESYVSKNIKPNDVVVIMGAGKSYSWTNNLVQKLFGVRFSQITSFRTGGKIKKYFEVSNLQDLIKTVEYVQENNLPLFVIGDGTDILVSDKDFDGAVIKYAASQFSIDETGEVEAEAGLNWDVLVENAVLKGFSGIESLSGIPGTVGAAPIQNIGAYGHEIKDTFVSLDAYDIKNHKVIKFNKSDCEFGYRDSVFKKESHWQKYVILKIKLKLSKAKGDDLIYESLKKYLQNDNPTLLDLRNAVLAARKDKLEDPSLIGNAGSFFKNPIISETQKQNLEKEYPDIKFFRFEDGYKISAGWLIEKTGWKGKTYKSAAVSSKHALILINPDGKANSQDVFELSEKIIKDIYDKFGVFLEREVQLINF